LAENERRKNRQKSFKKLVSFYEVLTIPYLGKIINKMTAQEHLKELKRNLGRISPEDFGKMYREHYRLLNDRNEESENVVKKLANYDYADPNSIFDGTLPLTFNVKSVR